MNLRIISYLGFYRLETQVQRQETRLEGEELIYRETARGQLTPPRKEAVNGQTPMRLDMRCQSKAGFVYLGGEVQVPAKLASQYRNVQPHNVNLTSVARVTYPSLDLE